MAYDKNKDYTTLINDAVNSGDYYSAAQYEQQRNEKITNEGLDYATTNRFSGWLDDTDYSTMLKDQMASGASADTVSETLKKRTQKAAGTEGLQQYAYDDTYNTAMDYILNYGNKSNQEFSYDTAPSWTSKYTDQINSLVSKLLNRDAFSYDYKTDPTYQQYAETYQREGNRAMQDTMAEAAAQTGGLASSYAVTAANQANNNYMAQLADKIPELEQLAYSRYQDDLSNDLSNLSMLQSLDNTDYGRYQDDLNQYNTDRSFNYGVYSDDRAYEQQDKSDSYDLAIAMINAGAMPSSEILRKAGISSDDATAMYDAVLAAAASTGSSSGGGGGSRSSSYSSSSTSESTDKLTQLFQDMRASGKPTSYLSAYGENYGVNKGMFSKILEEYKEWAATQDKLDNYTTYNAGQKSSGLSRDTYDSNVRSSYASRNLDDGGNERNAVHVTGYGWLSWQECLKLVDEGKIKETKNANGTSSFKKA